MPSRTIPTDRDADSLGFFGLLVARSQLDDAITAVVFGFQQGAVSPGNQRFGRVAGLEFGHAEAGGDAVTAQCWEAMFVRRRAESLRLDWSPSRCRNGSPAARTPRHRSWRPRSPSRLWAGQYGRKRDQRFVAGGVTMNIVDLFEVIDVADHQGLKLGPPSAAASVSSSKRIRRNELDWRSRSAGRWSSSDAATRLALSSRLDRKCRER